MIDTISNLAGGLGLLLLGMSMMTDGLKLATGNALRDILTTWTNTRFRGLFSGFLITGIVQSSSAVTVAIIGFTNAGMLTLERAIWVIFGSNVGTTITAWVVALIGFKFDIEGLALPLIGLGVLLRFSGAQRRLGSFGVAVIGFGLLFLGISFLKGGFENLDTAIPVPQVENLTFIHIALFVILGVVLTTLMQSSSAAIVMILGAAESGLVPLNAAAAVVIGANLGTTTTAVLVIIGATASAKRVAISHVVFNLVTASVAIVILGPLLWLVASVESLLNLIPSPAITLAIFHSIFNVLGVLLMWPLSSFLTRSLKKRFTTLEETVSEVQFLDKTVLALPYLAVDALAHEIARINHYCVSALRKGINEPEFQSEIDEVRVVRKLAIKIGEFSTELSRTQLNTQLSEMQTELMEATQQFLLTANIAEDMSELNFSITAIFSEKTGVAMRAYSKAISDYLNSQDSFLTERVIENKALLSVLEDCYKELKSLILRDASHGHIKMEDMDRLLQHSNQAKRACRQLMKGTLLLETVRENLKQDTTGKTLTEAKVI